jgi:hypothetical protein
MSCGCTSLLMKVTRSPTATTSCRGSVPAGEMRTIGASADAGVVGTVDGPDAGGLAGELPPQADAAVASAPITNEERIFRRL